MPAPENFSPCKSSNIAGMHHDGQDTFVKFSGGGAVWRYHNVPADIHDRVLNAPSIGKAFDAHIKNSYKAEKVG